MNSLRELCQPRASAFDTARRDTALDLTDLLERRISAADFFRENYRTSGMAELFRNAFRRFAGKSDVGALTGWGGSAIGQLADSNSGNAGLMATDALAGAFAGGVAAAIPGGSVVQQVVAAPFGLSGGALSAWVTSGP